MSEKSYIGFNNSGIVNLDDNGTGVKMLDKLSRIKEERRLKPLEQIENLTYEHRRYYDGYNLLIGDCYFIIPPEFIMVTSESTSQSIVTLRQENTQKMKSGYHKRTVMIDLVFNGMEQINGYEVESPEGCYYMDGLRQLLAQFKCTPFLPITNELINGMYGIFTVALQSITMSTVQGYPDLMTCQITLQEVNMFPYIEMPDVMFKYMIDWDLFRFYYQRFLTETNEYKKLQSLPVNKEHNHFKIGILDDTTLTSSTATQYSMLSIITDQNIIRYNEDGTKADTNYITWVDSATSDVVISAFHCGYSNLLTNIQLSDASSPTVQFMGGMDTIYSITFETTDYSVVQALEQCQMSNDNLVRNNTKLRSVGFVKLESELVKFTGSLFVMIENVSTNTVPGFPNLYNVQIQCVSYDVQQSEREQLNGFVPFDCDKCNHGQDSFVYEEPDHEHTNQVIEQNPTGLKRKIKQDNYAEWRLRTEMEVYPDLRLPTYNEVDSAITKIRTFKTKKGLPQLSYDKYPRQPVNMLHGLKPNNKVSFDVDNNFIEPDTIKNVPNEYSTYVDPDFYVFYPVSYESFLEENADYYDNYTPAQRESYTKTKTVTKNPVITDTSTSMGDPSGLTGFIQLARSFIGHNYVWGAYGDRSDSKGLVFDCSGLVSYCMVQCGMAPAGSRFTTTTIQTQTSYFEEIPYEDKRPGDLLLRPKSSSQCGHVAIYIGDNKVVHAWSSKYGVCETPLEKVTSLTKCYRIKTSSTSTTSSTITLTTSGKSNIEKIWNMLIANGCSEICAAGILGNMGRETGGTFNPRIVEGMTYSDTIPSKGGYGLVQYTYSGYKTGLKAFCKKNGVGVNTIEGQVGYLMTLISGKSYFTQMNTTNSIEEATRLFQDEFERPGVKAFEERLSYANAIYKQMAGKSGGESSTSEHVLTQSEFESICRAVAGETKGEPISAYRAMAQVIYDRLTHPTKKFGGLSHILSSEAQFKTYTGEIPEQIKNAVTAVFCDGSRFWSGWQAWYFLTPESNISTFQARDREYDRLSEVGKHVYWGKESKGSTIKFTILDSTGVSESSNNSYTYTEDIFHEAISLRGTTKFGQPVIVKTDGLMDKNDLDRSRDVLNSTENVFNTAFCDEVQYSGRARLVRAFPAYLFCILDDQAQWYDGKKLWTNYYVHRSVVDISVHATNDMPTETATVVVTNSYHNLDRTQGGLSSYKILEDDDYNGFQKWWYKHTGMLLGFGPKLTDKMIRLHQVIYNHAMLREGARIHLRMGYGSDPLSLAPVMNGHISDVSLGDQISIVVTSDGHELIQHITSANEKDTNNGWLGLFGLGESQESSNIIAGLLCKRSSWASHIFKGWFEASKYSIEHYGLYYNQGFWKTLGDTITANGWAAQYDILKNIYTANYLKEHYIYRALELGDSDEQNIVFNKYNMTPWDVCQICTQQVPEYIVKSTYHQFDSRLYFGLPCWMEKYRYDFLDGQSYEECKVAAQMHFLDSMSNIVDNQIRVTSKFSKTNVKVIYTRGKTAAPTQTIHSDDTIDMSKQKTDILDTPITQDALGPDLIYEFLGYNVGEDSARRVGISHLLMGWQQQYQGSLVCLGLPGVKPHDYLMVNDTFSNLYGICVVREVTHVFNTNTGFMSTVTPGMIAYSTDENSGMIEIVNNHLMLLNCFSNYTSARKELRNNYELNIGLIADIELMKSSLEAAVANSEKLNSISDIYGTVSNIVTAGLTFKICKSMRDLYKAGQLLSTITGPAMEAVKAVKGLSKISAFLKGIKTGTIIAGGSIGGVGAIVVAAIWLVVDILIKELITWLSNKNVCVLLPMWWEGYPFVAGVKGGEKILLMGSNAVSTDENNRAEGYSTGESEWYDITPTENN